MLKRVILLALVLSALLVSMVISSNQYGFAQQQEPDSTQMKLIWERVNVTVKKGVQYELLKAMVGKCPPFDSTHGEPWEFVINQWQRKQLEKIGAIVRVIAEIKPDEGPNQVEYKLVKEVDLKTDNVDNIVFGPKKDKGSALSELMLGLNGTDNEVCVYNPNFTLINKMHLYNATFSKNLRYIGGIEDVKVTHDVTEKGLYKFELFDYTGKKLWELERELYYDASYNGYSISNKGTVVEGDWIGILKFYNQNGNEIKKVELYRGTGDPGGQGMRGQFSEDGEYLFEIAHDDYGHAFGVGKGVMLFTSNGEELWRVTTDENGGGGLSISNHGNYMIVSAFVWPVPDTGFKANTYLLSQKGKLIKRYDNLYTGEICFSSNEEYALLVKEYNAYLIKSESGQILFKYTPSTRTGRIYSSDIAQDAQIFGFIACYPGTKRLVMEKEGNIEVMLMGFDGLKVWSDIFPSPDYRSLSPVNLRLSDDGKQMVIQIGKKIMVYQQVE